MSAKNLTPDQISEMTDEEWEHYLRSLNNVGDRLELVAETIQAMDDAFLRNDTINVYEAQLLHDRVKLLFETAVTSEVLVDELGEPMSREDWRALTSPVVAVDPLVPTAAEFELALDEAYADGADEAWDEAYRFGETDGIDLGIAMAGRVIRVLGGRVISPSALRQLDATD